MDAQLEQLDASVSSEECVEGVQSQYKCIGIQALPDVCHAQTQVAISPEVPILVRNVMESILLHNEYDYRNPHRSQGISV